MPNRFLSFEFNCFRLESTSFISLFGSKLERLERFCAALFKMSSREVALNFLITKHSHFGNKNYIRFFNIPGQAIVVQLRDDRVFEQRLFLCFRLLCVHAHCKTSGFLHRQMNPIGHEVC